ncbi:MAG: DedA family protein [Solirubrobacteraceae bacterium]
MSPHEIDHLLGQYGLALVFAMVALQSLCLPLPGTTALIAAALYAAGTHHLPIAGVVIAGASGAIVGTCGGYALGRWGGERVLHTLAARLSMPRERLDFWRRELALQGGKLVFFGRFVTGLRNVAGLVSGASEMPPQRFLLLSTAAASLWAVGNGLGYYWFGDVLSHADTWVQAVLILAGLGWLVVLAVVVRRRARERLRQASGYQASP